jgi:hypothetical protein
MDGIGGLFFALVLLFIVVIFGLLLVGMVKGIMEWHSNNQQPVQTLPALVIGKRLHVSGGSGNTSAHTSYYATFELQSGERREFPVSAHLYGLLAERDQGHLSFQGTRFKGYDRVGQGHQSGQRSW